MEVLIVAGISIVVILCARSYLLWKGNHYE